jgi:3-oxoacyl-(acyl-carrier-protein) synthase/NADP-dependent 3-hydroxy acid dehydrogenase YdfG/aryl carrier-like protein
MTAPRAIDYTASSYDSAVAVIGMALRLPGVTTPEAFWDMIVGQKSGLRAFTEEEMRAAGVTGAARAHPDYVAKGGLLDDIDQFDPAFFGFSAREARLLPPQNRLLFECCWEAIERAGIAPAAPGGHPCGVFMGQSHDSYWQNIVSRDPDEATSELSFMANADYLATAIAHRFDLRGPAMTVQSFCSTSLLAVHMARQAIIEGQCETALAGGASVRVPQAIGYTASPQTIYSPDGIVRSFDKDANGTLFGNGVGVVMLKRLDLALADKDPIVAVLRGTAANNDGGRKVSYNAPSVQGQARAVANALREADVSPDSIGYVECHGTATAMGDPIEIAALTQAFGSDLRGSCALGTAKTHVGHVDRAAGVIGLIKAGLTLQHQRIPQLLNYQNPNPALNLESSPFYVPQATAPWIAGDAPRRCGVNALGYGGTNVHAVLEEVSVPDSRPVGGPVLLPVSARDPSALVATCSVLADWIASTPDVDLARVSETLCFGRSPLEYRFAAVCETAEDAVEALRAVVAPEKSDPAVVCELPPDAPLKDFAVLWVQGATLNFDVVCDRDAVPRYALPTTAFSRVRCWVDSPQVSEPVALPEPSVDDGHGSSGFGVPQWEPAPLIGSDTPKTRIVYAADPSGGAQLVSQLLAAGNTAILITDGDVVANVADGVYTVDPTEPAQIGQVLDRLKLWGPEGIVIVMPDAQSDPFAVRQMVTRWMTAVGETWSKRSFDFDVVARGIAQVSGDDPVDPAMAMIPAVLRTAMIEVPHVQARAICASPRMGQLGNVIAGSSSDLVALRGRRLWQQTAQPISDAPVGRRLRDAIRRGGTYVVTGALGGIGSALAVQLLEEFDAHVVAIARNFDVVGTQADRLAELRAAGGRLTEVAVDLCHRDRAAVLEPVVADRAAIHGVFHAAGRIGDTRLAGSDPARLQSIMAPKTTGLKDVLRITTPQDFAVLFSSMAALAPSLGQLDYAAANAYLDGVAQQSDHDCPVLSINWNSWRDQGAMVDAWAQPVVQDDVIPHPLITRQSRYGDGRIAFDLTASGWLCKDHVVAGQAVLSGTTLAELILTGFAQMAGKTGQIDQLVMTKMVPTTAMTDARLVFHPEPAGCWFVEIVSSAGAGPDGHHAVGRVSLSNTVMPHELDTDTLVFEPVAEVNLAEGPVAFSGRWICDLAQAGSDLMRVMLDPAFVSDCDDHLLHPALFDIATSVFAAMQTQGDALPVAYRGLCSFAPLPACVIVQRAGAGVVLYDIEGRPLAQIAELVFADAQDAAQTVVDIIDSARLAAPVLDNPFAADSVSLNEGLSLLLDAPLDLSPQLFVSRQFAAGHGALQTAPAPTRQGQTVAGPVEIKPFLRDAWATFLGAPPTDDHDNFLACGGNSLVATRFIARIKDTLGVTISLRNFFETPTIDALAAMIVPQVENSPGDDARVDTDASDADAWEEGTI